MNLELNAESLKSSIDVIIPDIQNVKVIIVADVHNNPLYTIFFSKLIAKFADPTKDCVLLEYSSSLTKDQIQSFVCKESSSLHAAIHQLPVAGWDKEDLDQIVNQVKVQKNKIKNAQDTIMNWEKKPVSTRDTALRFLINNYNFLGQNSNKKIDLENNLNLVFLENLEEENLKFLQALMKVAQKTFEIYQKQVIKNTYPERQNSFDRSILSASSRFDGKLFVFAGKGHVLLKDNPFFDRLQQSYKTIGEKLSFFCIDPAEFIEPNSD